MSICKKRCTVTGRGGGETGTEKREGGDGTEERRGKKGGGGGGGVKRIEERRGKEGDRVKVIIHDVYVVCSYYISCDGASLHF